MAPPSLQQLAAERYVSLVTFRRNGNGVPTPIWIAAADGKLYAFTDGTSAKMKRLKVTDRVRLAACDMRGAVRGEYVEGRARRVEDPAMMKRAYSALAHKYGWQVTLLNLFSRLFGRIGRRAFIEISI
jgi:PPOX class probable F420-dependent enzyme